jgi:3-oxoacyl-[acyl-carrier-protein] synthase II
MSRRVVVTGVGMVTPFGCGVSKNWQEIIAGNSCITTVESLDLSALSVKIGGEIKWTEHGGWFDPTCAVEKKNISRMAKFITYAMVAAQEAVKDCGIDFANYSDPYKCGVSIGSGIGGLEVTENQIRGAIQSDPARVTPFFIPSVLVNLASGNVAIKYNLRGPNVAAATACAAGKHAIIDGYRFIAEGYADVMVCGGAESTFCMAAYAGFSSLRALSTKYNHSPKEASRPYDKNRDGFILSEGSGVLVLEELNSALKRGAKIYGEIIGAGLSGDAHHITAPHSEGFGAANAIQMALNKAQINPSDVNYINSHGTSTPLGDEAEIKAIMSVFGDDLKNIAISSTKSSTGHMLGATGAIETIFCLLAMQNKTIPATINLHEPDDLVAGLNLVPNTPQEGSVNIAISNSFGFGGCNATLVMKNFCA